MHDKFDGDIDMFADVAWMFVAHIVCIIAIMLRNCYTSNNNAGTLARSLLGGVKCWFYLLALLGVMVADCQIDDRVSLAQIKEHNCPGIRQRLNTIDDFRQLELCVFYSQIFGIMGYLIVSMILVSAKKRFTSQADLDTLVNSSDPYWRHLLAPEDNDFLEVDNMIMSSITLMICNVVIINASTAYIFPNIFKHFMMSFGI